MKRPWLRHPLTLALALGLLIAALALLGPSLGLASPASRLAAVLLLLLLVAGAALVRLQLSLRPAPAREVERNGIAAQVRGAVRALLNSHLGATRGRGALYELPWLLVLGPPGAGKTSLIRNSGLSFPLAPAGDPDLAPGCRWNFSSQGVLLDVPGRHACPEDEPAEWLEFLRQLRRQRPGGPLDGLLLTLPLPELRGPECAARAGQLRCRISELEAILGRKVPVYLLITKMDLLPGFASFFEDLTAAERSQAWGAALGHPQGPAFDPVRAVAGHFAQLHQGLSEHGARQLAQHPSNQDRPALTTFPLAFRQLGPALATFTEHLAGQDPYHVRPFLRGFYFASTLQEPAAPADLLPGFDLGTASGARAPRPGSHPCFLAQLFSQVIFPDRSLARQLGAILREKAEVEDRLESVDEKTEVYEYIYELASQRMGEYRNARREMILEIAIIVILVVETIATDALSPQPQPNGIALERIGGWIGQPAQIGPAGPERRLDDLRQFGGRECRQVVVQHPFHARFPF